MGLELKLGLGLRFALSDDLLNGRNLRVGVRVRLRVGVKVRVKVRVRVS